MKRQLITVLFAALGAFASSQLLINLDQNPSSLKGHGPTPIFTSKMQDGKYGLRLGIQLMTPFEYDSIDLSGSYPILYSNVKDRYIFNLKSTKKTRLVGPFTTVDQIDPDIFLVGPVYGDYAFYKAMDSDLIFNDTIRVNVKGIGGLKWIYTKSGEKGIFSNLKYRGYVLPLDYYVFVDVKKDYIPYASGPGIAETFLYSIQYYTKNSWGFSYTQIGGEMHSQNIRICQNNIIDKKFGVLFGINTAIHEIYDNGFATLKSGSNYALISNGCDLVVPFEYHDYSITDSVGYFFSDSTTLRQKIVPIEHCDIYYHLRRDASPKLDRY